jgi:hypothetical protein
MRKSLTLLRSILDSWYVLCVKKDIDLVLQLIRLQLIYDVLIMQDLAHIGFCQLALNTETENLSLVDECGCIWDCTLQFVTRPHAHFKIGGGWNRMVKARRLKDGDSVVIGAPYIGVNEKLFFFVVCY